MTSTADANPQQPSDRDFVGLYSQGGMESLAQLILLEDHTFCYALMAGNLDLIKAGRWKAGHAPGTIDLEEIRPDSPIHPAIGGILDRLGPPRVGINLDGLTLSKAHSPVFAVTRTETPPATFRPLFDEENSRWSMTYALPLLSPDEARYIFIGDIEVDSYRRPKRLRVTQYAVGRYDTIRVGFDPIQSEPPLRMTLRLAQGVLWQDDDRFGTRKPLTPQMIAEVREQCIQPALQSGRARPGPSAEEEAPPPENREPLTPLRTLSLDVTAIAGAPWFPARSADSPATDSPATDSLERLVESEQQQLEAAVQRAKDDIRSADQFLELAKAVAGKKNRIAMQAPVLVKRFAELLAATYEKGNFDASERIFLHFKKDIYPAVAGVDREGIAYGLSEIASLGLIIVTKTRNAEIRDFIFDELLGDQFDIARHKNTVLIYNLACYQAVNNNKTAMLAALKEVRRRGVPPKQFMEDPDFRHYRNDTEFLDAIQGPAAN